MDLNSRTASGGVRQYPLIPSGIQSGSHFQSLLLLCLLNSTENGNIKCITFGIHKFFIERARDAQARLPDVLLYT